MSRPRDLSVDSLKGISILAVILLHLLANLRFPIFNLPYALVFLNLNLLLRFCVPAFIFLSGYTLALKYLTHSFHINAFYFKRFRQIVPLYLFWALITILFFQLDPFWKQYAPSFSIFNLLYGGLDYHFYFIPVLIGLYLLFPLLFSFFSRWPYLSLIASLSLTGAWYFLINLPVEQGLGSLAHLTDQAQYRSLFTWLGYFSSGIFFGTKLTNIKKKLLNNHIILIFWILSVILLLSKAWNLYSLKVDVIDISKFTQQTVFVYALIGIVTYLIYAAKYFATSKLLSFFSFLGRQSYVIYLSHTLAIRILFGFIYQTVSPFNLSLSLGFLFLAYLFSYYLGRYLVQ